MFLEASDKLQHLRETKVGILGAGIAGLYAALILDSLDIQYEILEASDRTGGRMLTYQFPGGGKYDYYDAGAMRFSLPEKNSQGQYKNGITKRLAKLIEYEPLNQGRNGLKDALVPYYFQVRPGSKPGICYINGTHNSPFGAQAMGVDSAYIRVGVEAITNDITEPFVRMLLEDMETGERKGWKTLMANDSYTLRSYMTTKYIPSAHLGLPPEHLPSSVVEWYELLGYPVDHALSETVILSMLFPLPVLGSANHRALEWKCLEGGSQTLPKRIEDYLRKKGNFIRFNSKVTAMKQSHTAMDIRVELAYSQPSAHSDESSADGFAVIEKVSIPSMTVTVNNNETREYSHVISTIPLPVLRTVDLSDAGLDVMQGNAIKKVDCHPVVKIAILFESNWWTTKLGIVGGQSIADLPLREIIYPSHGVNSDMPSRVLVVYTEAGDALRLGTLATSKHADALKELVLRSLAEIHNGLHPDVTYTYLKEQFIDMRMKDWARDECTMGGFSVFRPGYFRDFYPLLTQPAAGNCLYIAGEGANTYHAWVLGALISSWRAVHDYLEVTGQDEKMKMFEMLWGNNAEWRSKPPS